LCTTTAYRAAAAADDDEDGDDGKGDSLGLVILTIDGVQVDLNHTLFTYTDNPVITSVQPATSFVTFVLCFSCALLKTTAITEDS